MKVSIDEKTNEIIITLPLNKKGTLSKTGKSLVIASTAGALTSETTLGEKPIIVNATIWVKKD